MSLRITFLVYILVAITCIIFVNTVSANAFPESFDLSYDNEGADSATMPYQDLESIVPDKIEASSDEFTRVGETAPRHHKEFYDCVLLCWYRSSMRRRTFTECIET
ncbi:22820_t:CDS:1, partial [Dentiscutata erythropus]